MVLRIHNLESWVCLTAGQAIPLFAGKRRVVRIDFNAEDKAALHITDPDGNVMFLGLVEGLKTVEFTAGSPEFAVRFPDVEDCRLLITATSEGSVYYRTVDGDVEGYSSVAESFVKVATRRTRNPELELMMWKQEQNMRRREEKMAGDVAALMAKLEAQSAITQNVNSSPSGSQGVAPNGETVANDNASSAGIEGASGEGAASAAVEGDGAGAAGKAGAAKSPAKGAKRVD